MTQARAIIRNALTFGLNRLSPGEQEDADLFGRCLDALASIVDEMNGLGGLLWREVMTQSTPITGTTGTLGTTWAGLVPGQQILGATVSVTGVDQPMAPITVEQYQSIPIKAVSAPPYQYAHDGQSTVYIYPAAAGHVITLRTKQLAQSFADLDANYIMPPGYQSALEALLAEKMADALVGGISPKVASDAGRARKRLASRNLEPAILSQSFSDGRLGAFLAGR